MLVLSQRWKASDASSGPFRRGAERRFLEFLGILHEFRPSWVGRQGLALFQNQFLEFLDSQIVNQEFDARAVAIFLFSQPREDPGNRLRQRQQFLDRHKGIEQFRLVRNGAKSSAHVHGKPALFFAVFGARDGDQAQVVHVREAAGVLRAAAERGLEFPAEALAVRVAEQEFRQRAGIGRDVEDFVLADAGIGAGGNIAHRISAGFARGDIRGGQAAHQRSAYRQCERNEAESPDGW